MVRSDLRRTGAGHAVVVAIGRYCFLGERQFNYYLMKIADHVFIGEDSVIEAAQIGSYVHIGRNCVIGRFAIIKDCCRILDGAVVPPNAVVPSFSVYGGNPARLVDELPESIQEVYEQQSKEFFDEKFVLT
ncbi:hypothetical protein HDU86_003437 [Geranomyces michiganensis]|nr:hypothetical protein HDU86_003437 [Geranomyces michiganensis]